MQVKLIHITPDAEKHIAYCARVSNPANQDNPEYAKLLSYCMRQNHWSIYEMSSFCIEITTSRAISAQILRHKSLSAQEFSSRYQIVETIEEFNPRRQDVKNRQNSIDDLPESTVKWFKDKQKELNESASQAYKHALALGVAKESARALLPMSSQTRLYLHGNIRSWLTYLKVRLHPSTQLEHREIAEEIWKIFKQELPIIAEAAKQTYPEVFT